jgi:sugar-specific transcriptional regulator TrmB
LQEDSDVFSDEFKKTKNELILFGIPEREASLYVALLSRGESRAAELASFLGLHRLDVYHDLKGMQSKNIVEGTISKPMKFKAVPLDVVVKDLRKKELDTQSTRNEALSDLEKASRELRHRSIASDQLTRDKIQIISGQKAISERWNDLLTSAKSEILVAAIDRGSAKLLLMRGLEEITRKMRSGVSVRIFTPISQEGTDQFKEVAPEVRHLDSINSAGVCIVDRREVMIIPEPGNAPGSHQDETAILITSPSIVEMFRVLFFVGWDTSPSIVVGKDEP